MQNPNGLKVAAQARTLAKMVYGATDAFPARERYGLTAQMRRAAISVGSTIYEGCGRCGPRELAHYLHMAVGSVRELEFQALVATDLGFLRPDIQPVLMETNDHTRRMLVSLITVIGRRNKDV